MSQVLFFMLGTVPRIVKNLVWWRCDSKLGSRPWAPWCKYYIRSMIHVWFVFYCIPPWLPLRSIWPLTVLCTVLITGSWACRLHSALPIHTPSINPKCSFGVSCHPHKGSRGIKEELFSARCLWSSCPQQAWNLPPKQVGPWGSPVLPGGTLWSSWRGSSGSDKGYPNSCSSPKCGGRFTGSREGLPGSSRKSLLLQAGERMCGNH